MQRWAARSAEVVQKTLQRLGLDVRRARRTDAEYALVVPPATYAPWNVDQDFARTYEQIREHTLVDVYRCYELWSLTRELAHVPGALIEVGVWRGGTGAIVAKSAALAGIGDCVYLCDTFCGVPKAGERDPVYRGGEHADTSRASVEALIGKLGLSNVAIAAGVFPDETAREVRADRFRFAHIDVDTYRSAKDCVEYLWPRMSAGAVVVFDDYGFDGLRGVREYADELRGKPDRLFVHNLNGHGLLIKLADVPTVEAALKQR
jgi:O-methyltransferase